MINLIKLEEPQVLVNNYKNWTDTLISHQQIEEGAGKSIPHYVKSKYRHKDIKDTLKKETHGKCAYCESKILATSFGDVEHIIPKTFDTYMWFRWSNLTLGCQVCNNNKSDYHDDDNPLIDPYIDDVDKHLIFVGSVVVPITVKGILTVSILDLNRTDLVEERTHYLNKTINPFFQHIAMQTNQALKLKLLEDSYEYAKESEKFSKMCLKAISLLTDKTGLVS